MKNSAERKKRNSIQKQMIRDAFLHLHHPTATEIYEYIRQQYPSISLATVYRNLGDMAASGLLEKISFPDEPDRFEPMHHPHFHGICSVCGSVSDINCIEPELLTALDRSIYAKKGFTVQTRNLNFVGICAGCREKNGTSR